MTQKHSSEPWCTDQMSHEEPLMDITIIAANDDRVAKVWIDDAPVEDFNARQRLNARRIVACVNACAGLPTEQLEPSPLGGVLNGVAGLIAQRDELLAALEAFTSAQDAKRSASGNGAGPIAAAIGNLVIAEERARAAIKKITGATK